MQQVKGLVPHEPMIYYDYLVNHKYSLFTQRGLCKYCVDPYQTAPEEKILSFVIVTFMEGRQK